MTTPAPESAVRRRYDVINTSGQFYGQYDILGDALAHAHQMSSDNASEGLYVVREVLFTKLT